MKNTMRGIFDNRCGQLVKDGGATAFYDGNCGLKIAGFLPSNIRNQ